MSGYIYVKFREEAKLWKQKADEILKGWGQEQGPTAHSAMDCGDGCTTV